MLRSQNIDECIVMDVLSEIDESEYNQILTVELQKKRKTVRDINEFEIRGKMFRFAASRGFEPEIVHKIISKMIGS
jgi:regulatory protein